MGMWHVQSDNRHTDLGAGDGFFYCFCNAFRKKHERCVVLVGKVENIVDLFFGDYKHMARMHRADVEKGEMAGILGHLV